MLFYCLSFTLVKWLLLSNIRWSCYAACAHRICCHWLAIVQKAAINCLYMSSWQMVVYRSTCIQSKVCLVFSCIWFWAFLEFSTSLPSLLEKPMWKKYFIDMAVMNGYPHQVTFWDISKFVIRIKWVIFSGVLVSNWDYSLKCRKPHTKLYVMKPTPKGTKEVFSWNSTGMWNSCLLCTVPSCAK